MKHDDSPAGYSKQSVPKVLQITEGLQKKRVWCLKGTTVKMIRTATP